MDAIRTTLRTLCADERGATAVEYGLICALIVLGMLTGLETLGSGVSTMWTNLANTMSAY